MSARCFSMQISNSILRNGIPLNRKELPRGIEIGDRLGIRNRNRMELLISAGNDLARNDAGLWPAARFSTSNILD